MPVFFVEVWEVTVPVRYWRRIAECRTYDEAVREARARVGAAYHTRIREEWRIVTGPR